MSSKNILIVEDELIISLIIEKMVKNMGHRVVGKVRSGEEAIYSARSLKPDLILMDIRLQGEIDGIEAMTEIRKLEDIPVIYITGNTDQMYRNRIQRSEYLDFLTKPVTFDDLTRSFSQAS
ncbi:MAG: response regulator [Balneolaceae bacterium]|nr:response regulator [Balneolaceae bacterium]